MTPATTTLHLLALLIGSLFFIVFSLLWVIVIPGYYFVYIGSERLLPAFVVGCLCFLIAMALVLLSAPFF